MHLTGEERRKKKQPLNQKQGIELLKNREKTAKENKGFEKYTGNIQSKREIESLCLIKENT